MSAAGKVYFADSNLLLYAVNTADPDKQRQAAAWLDHLWSAGVGRLSWQVLHEFYWNATRKLHLSEDLARTAVRQLSAWRPVDSSLGLIARAWIWADQAQLPYWDGLILAAAERCEADYLLSEDFQAGRQYGGCTVLNPFQAAPDRLS